MSKRIGASGWIGIAAGLLGCGGEAPSSTSHTSARALHGPSRGAERHHHGDGQLPSCAGTPTRRIWFTGNAQIVPGQTWPAWDPAQSQRTGLWSTATDLSSSDGYAVSVVFYFLPEGDAFGYHALLADSLLELASGRLHFDPATGALQSVEEARPLRLWSPRGFEAPIELFFGTPLAAGGTGLDGVTGLNTWTSLQYARDGQEPQLGVACLSDPEVSAAPTPSQPALDPEPVLCAARSSTRVSLRGNLDPEIPIADAAWDATQPDATSTLTALLEARDASGHLVTLSLFLIKRSARGWEYHALLLGDVPGPELGSGRLFFNSNGTLQRVDVGRAVRLPRRDGSLGPRLTLNFGRPTSAGGTGADGLTSFTAATALISREHDGNPAAISARCLDPSPVPPWRPELQFWGPGAFLNDRYPLCTGALSTRVIAYPVLSRFTPIATVPWELTAPPGPSDDWTSTRVFDTTLAEVPIEIRFRRVAEDSWEAHVLLTEAGELVERATSRLDVDAGGLLAHVEGDRSVLLRLPDGRQGPPLTLDFGLPLDERGLHSGEPFVRYQEPNAGIYADGWGPSVCVGQGSDSGGP